MKIPKKKALILIDEKISNFERLKSEATFGNIYDSGHKLVYHATEAIILELFSKNEVLEFKSKTNVFGGIWVGQPEDPMQELQDYRLHLEECIVMLKAYRERIDNFWMDDAEQVPQTKVQDTHTSESGESKGKELEHGQMIRNRPDPRCVFVVHGRNEQIRNSIFNFLRALDLHPMEWNEAVAATGKATPFVGEILEAALKKAQAVVVLLTPDDIGKLSEEFVQETDPPFEKEFTPQARLNVIYEAGMAMGLYPDRTVIVEIGQLRPFSDNAGRHTVRLDDSPEKRNVLVQRLKVAGCHMNLVGNHWLTEGDFSVVPLTKSIPDEGLNKPQKRESQSQEKTLDDVSLKILQLLVKDAACSSSLARSLHLEEQRVIYSLVELEKDGYVFQGFYDSEFRIDQRGREYLIKKGLL